MASNCDVSKGKISLQCKNGTSGMDAIFVANYDDYGFTSASTDVGGHIMTSLGTLTEVFQYTLKNTGNTFNQAIASSRDNGTTTYTQVVNFVLTGINKDMEFQLKMLAWGRPYIFVKLTSGQYIILGYQNGCEITGQSSVAGTYDGLNGYQLVATATEKDPIYYLDSATVTALEAIVSINNIA